MDKPQKVAEIMDKSTGLWKLEEIEDDLTPHQKQSLLVPICQKGGKDKWCDMPMNKGYIYFDLVFKLLKMKIEMLFARLHHLLIYQMIGYGSSFG